MSRHDPDPDARIAALLMQVDASLTRSRDWIASRGEAEPVRPGDECARR
ncbi:hypothetical protein TPR58_22335 [Sphingomonas sp. HF-S3]|uniref:Uncharacterized protein n=1 Tax=Sphingomonas rustica TaxID=3103142 RepID=A0ABV0BEG2_9SPHN